MVSTAMGFYYPVVWATKSNDEGLCSFAASRVFLTNNPQGAIPSNCFSIALVKHHDPKQLAAESIYFILQLSGHPPSLREVEAKTEEDME